LPWQKQVNSMVQTASWIVGFPAGLATILAFLLPQNIPIWLHMVLIGSTLIWLLSYQIGLAHNIRPFHFSRSREIKEHVVMLILTVPLGLLETYAAFTAPFYRSRWVWVSAPKSKSEYFLLNAPLASPATMAVGPAFQSTKSSANQ